MSRRRGSSEAPITLFSFQDLICSISGIMILVALLMALDLVSRKAETPAAATAQDASTAEADRKIAAMTQEREGLEKDLARGQRVVADLQGKDPKRIAIELKAKETEQERLARELADRRARLEELEKMGKTAEQQKEKLSAEVAKLNEEMDKLNRQRKDLEAVPRVVIAPPGQLRKTPILAVCSGKGIETSTLGGERAVKSFGAPGADPEALARDFMQWATSRNRDQEFFFLLVKPSAAPYARQLIVLLRERRFEVGYDPLEEEKVAAFEDKPKP